MVGVQNVLRQRFVGIVPVAFLMCTIAITDRINIGLVIPPV